MIFFFKSLVKEVVLPGLLLNCGAWSGLLGIGPRLKHGAIGGSHGGELKLNAGRTYKEGGVRKA